MNDHSTKSYWHKEPSAKLTGHRTTAELPRAADIAIVGSGITGAFAAHFLREKRPDLHIVMVDAREACWGATGRNGGHCQPAMYLPPPHIASFELRNFAFLRDLVEQHSIPCDWRSTSGVHAYYSAELFGLARQKVAALTDRYPDLAANVAVVEKGGEGGGGGAPSWLLPGERRELTLAALRVPRAEGAVVQWNAASLWPYKLVAFVLERLLAANDDDSAAEKKGSFNLQTNTRVTGLTKAETPSGSASTMATTTTWTLHTPRGTLTAPQVLLATNGYTAHLLPALADMLVPTRGQVSALKAPPPPPARPSQPAPSPALDIGHTFYFMGEPDSAFTRDDYLVQRPPSAPSRGSGEGEEEEAGGELIFGGGRRHARGAGVGVDDDSEVEESVSWYLRGELAGGLMDLSPSTAPSAPASTAIPDETADGKSKQDLEPTYEWTGIMGYTRDGHPLVGRVPASLGGDGDGDDGDPNHPNPNPHQNHSGLWLCAGYSGHGMPNAALCARAAAAMMTSAPAEEIDLPPEYVLTAARVAAARAGRDEVAVADARGSLWADFGAGMGLGLGS